MSYLKKQEFREGSTVVKSSWPLQTFRNQVISINSVSYMDMEVEISLNCSGKEYLLQFLLVLVSLSLT